MTTRTRDYLGHIATAATDACDFVREMDKEAFLKDKRTQQAVIMSLIIIGEAATKLMDSAPEFVAKHPEIPWRNMRGMRNRVAHGYFEINLELVWDTLQTALPDLQVKIAGLADAEDVGAADSSP